MADRLDKVPHSGQLPPTWLHVPPLFHRPRVLVAGGRYALRLAVQICCVQPRSRQAPQPICHPASASHVRSSRVSGWTHHFPPNHGLKSQSSPAAGPFPRGCVWSQPSPRRPWRLHLDLYERVVTAFDEAPVGQRYLRESCETRVWENSSPPLPHQLSKPI